MSKRRSSRKVAVVWALGAEREGSSAVKIFVQDGEVQCIRIDRIVQQQPDGYYAAYRSGADEPFLIAKDVRDAIGIAERAAP